MCPCFAGVHRHRQNVTSGKETKLRAEVFRILNKYPEAGWFSVNIKSAVKLHHKFVKPEYVLQPHIKLMTFEDDLAYFAVCPPDVNVYDLGQYPFLFLALPQCCEQMVAMPLSDLKRLGEKVGKTKCKNISWIFHLTRCGSTALGQALNSIPGITVQSESRFWLACFSELLAKHGENYGHTDECRQLYEASLNLVLKDFSAETNLVVRAIGGCDHEFLMPYAIKHFPESKFIYMYRDMQGVVRSMWRGLGSKDKRYFRRLREKSKHDPERLQKYRRYIVLLSCGLDEDVLAWGDQLDEGHLLVMAWITNIRYFKQYGPRIKNLMTICFEDLISQQRKTLSEVRQIHFTNIFVHT